MTKVEPESSPRLGRAPWLLIILSAALAVYFGLSSLLLPFFGAPNLHAGIERWLMPATGALQLMAAAMAFRFAARRDLRGATLALAMCLMLGWLETLSPVLRNGLAFRGEAGLTSAWFLALPVIALSAAALAWRNPHPILAALIVTAPTTVGLLFTIAFAIIIAIHGF